MYRILVTIVLLFFCFEGLAQSPYLIEKDPKNPDINMPVGQITKYLLLNDPSYSWYKAGLKGYVPPVRNFSISDSLVNQLSFVVFAGTWCDDSQFILPRFFLLMDALSVPDERISLFTVDRNKRSTGNIASAFAIKNVPTIILMKSGKEIGRVVEYGITGKWDEELLGLIK